MTDMNTAAGKLTKAERAFILSRFWESPRGKDVPALAADTAYSPARAIDRLGLGERVNDQKGTNWFYLNATGLALRAHLRPAQQDLFV